MEARENAARHAQNQSSHKIKNRWPARTPSSPQQVAPDMMLFNEVNNRMKSFEELHSKLLFKANEALQDASTVSWMLTCIKQLLSTQSTQYTEHVSPLFVSTPPVSPGFFPVTPLLSQRSHTRPKSPLFVPTPPVSPGFFPVTPLLSQRSHTRPKNAQNPVGCSSSPKLREKIDSVETPIDKYFDEAENVTENAETTWRKTVRGRKGAGSEVRFKARQEAWNVMSSLSPKVLESLSPKGGKPVATPVPVRIPVHVPAGVSEDPDTTNRGDNEGIVTFAESRPTVISTVQQQPVNKDATGGDENKVELSRFASMFPPQPTIGHDVPLKESDSSNEGEISNGEESEKPEQDRSPESKHEGAGTDALSSNDETECVSSESPATELSDKEDMEDDSANRGEKDNRFAQSSDQEKREAIREIESTMNDAKNNAAFLKTQSPTWYDRFECKCSVQKERDRS